MKKLKYILIIFCFTLYYSCDSFLDVRPEGEVVNNELFKNAEGFEDAIYGVYSTLAGPSYYGRTMTYYFNDILSDYPFMHLLYSQLLVCQRVCLQNTVCLICK